MTSGGVGVRTVTTADATLFAGFGSNSAPATIAVLVATTGAVARATTTSVADAPSARPPTHQIPVAGL